MRVIVSKEAEGAKGSRKGRQEGAICNIKIAMGHIRFGLMRLHSAEAMMWLCLAGAQQTACQQSEGKVPGSHETEAAKFCEHGDVRPTRTAGHEQVCLFAMLKVPYRVLADHHDDQGCCMNIASAMHPAASMP